MSLSQSPKPVRKVIAAERAGGAAAWVLPLVGEEAAGGGAEQESARPLTAAQIETLHRQAYEDGFQEGRKAGHDKGYQEGRATGQAETKARVNHLESVLRTLARPLDELDEQLVQSLVQLAVGVARHVVRRELRTDPAQVVAVIRAAVSALPLASRTVYLYLHPEDAALVRDLLSVGEAESAWRIMEDPVLSRGGCRVATEASQIDATLESRLAAVVARVMGEARESERTA